MLAQEYRPYCNLSPEPRVVAADEVASGRASAAIAQDTQASACRPPVGRVM